MNLIDKISSFQEGRFAWLLMSFVAVFLVVLAHSFFQNYLYMPPCEQCVYIRFAFLCMGLGGLIAALNPKIWILSIAGYAFAFWGALQGIIYSLKLAKIHSAVHGDDPFGVQGCSTEPVYPFNLALHEWAPDWFLPTGDCGYDNPIIPSTAVLSDIQRYFIELYSEGWYLVPSKQLFSMADCTLFGFGLCFLLLSLMFISKVVVSLKNI